MLAAPKSGSGKTTVTCALIGVLHDRGRNISSFKCGPDYIDPMFHRSVLGVRGGNLDSFFTPGERLQGIFAQRSAGSDLAVIEGVMGYYDGAGQTTQGSSYEIAQLTRTPVILVVDAKGASVSLAASIRGLMDYRKDSRIRGIILNRVSPGYYPRIRAFLQEELSIPVLGYLPDEADLMVLPRHLGLQTPDTRENQEAWVARLKQTAQATLDFQGILKVAEEAGEVPAGVTPDLPHLSSPVRIAIAKDRAFDFYYTENEELLTEMGAELVPFSPLCDVHLPEDIDGLYLGGGYPEQCLEALHANRQLRRELKSAVAAGLPTIAECGGFLYLHEKLQPLKEHPRKLCGVLSCSARETEHLVRFGYASASSVRGGLLGDAGVTLPCHEFHYWESDDPGDGFVLTRTSTGRKDPAIHYTDTLLAGFPHFYFPSDPTAFFSFLKACSRVRTGKRIRSRWDALAKPIDSFGKLEDTVIRIGQIRGEQDPGPLTPRALLVFAGDHGVVREGVTQTDSSVTRKVAENLASGRGAASILAGKTGTDLFVLDAGMDTEPYDEKELVTGTVVDRKVRRGTEDLAVKDAMTLQECRKALETGAEAACSLAGRGYRLLAVGEMGIGNTTAAGVLAGHFLGLPAERVTGRGAGLDDAGLSRKVRVVRRSLDRIRDVQDPTGVLAAAGGLEIAAMAGVFLGAVRCGVPVLIDGVISAAAALSAVRIDPRAAQVMLATHLSGEHLEKKILKELKLSAFLTADLAQGEGCGALMALPLLDLALEIYHKLDTFQDEGILPYRRYPDACS